MAKRVREYNPRKGPLFPYIRPCLSPCVIYSCISSGITETTGTVIISYTIMGLYGEFHFCETPCKNMRLRRTGAKDIESHKQVSIFM